MDFIKYVFNEDEWNIYLIEDDDDDLTNGQAEVFFEKKEIYIKKSSLSLSVIKHELWHVYFKYCYLDDASMEQHQMEEVSASLFEDKAEKMLERAKDIYKKLRVLKDTVKGKDE